MLAQLILRYPFLLLYDTRLALTLHVISSHRSTASVSPNFILFTASVLLGWACCLFSFTLSTAVAVLRFANIYTLLLFLFLSLHGYLFVVCGCDRLMQPCKMCWTILTTWPPRNRCGICATCAADKETYQCATWVCNLLGCRMVMRLRDSSTGNLCVGSAITRLGVCCTRNR